MNLFIFVITQAFVYSNIYGQKTTKSSNAGKEDLQSFTKGLERKQGLPNCPYSTIQVLFIHYSSHTLSLCVHIMHKLIQCKDPISLKRMLRIEVLSDPAHYFELISFATHF